MSDNLKFWNTVQGTDPKHTQDASISGQKRTAVNAQYKKKLITEQFGMYGIGWGVEPDSEKFSRQSYDNGTVILTYNATAFYKHNGETGRFPIAAAIKEAFVTSGGKGYLKVDDEAVKKVRTDALTKGFTDLGFNADIQMKMYDDSSYVQDAAIKAQAKAYEKAAQEMEEIIKEIDSWLVKEVETARSIPNKKQASKYLSAIIEKLRNKSTLHDFNPTSRIERLNQVINELIGESENASK